MGQITQVPREWPVADGHRTAERRSLAMHAVIAGRLDEAMLARARARVDDWLRDSGPVDEHWARAWRDLLAREVEAVAVAIIADDPVMTQLRQTTPFAGAITTTERNRILREVRCRMRRSDLEHVIRAASSIADENDNTRGAIGWCLEPHDAVAAKLVAGREHDVAFAAHAIRAGLVERSTVGNRIAALPIDEDHRVHAASLLALATARASDEPGD